MIGYRVVEIRNGKVMSLFHGTNGSREIYLNIWNAADKKPVQDGSGKKNRYISGWHFLQSREECEKFFDKMFRVKKNRYVVLCIVRGNIRAKHTEDFRGNPCWLADEIFIPGFAVAGLL